MAPTTAFAGARHAGPIEIVKVEPGRRQCPHPRERSRVDFRRVEATSLKMPTRFTSAEGKRSFVRMFRTLQLNTHFISVIAHPTGPRRHPARSGRRSVRRWMQAPSA
ncbi:MAG: hypothetical protein IPG83_17735 [Novosphingobium sp.]|nr:hypothetical protein [Novosphingobium sp.]